MDNKGDNLESVVIVTGNSGAGKSSVLASLEDNGYFCVDNMPLEFVNSFLDVGAHTAHIGARVALGIDIRTVSSIEQCVGTLITLKNRLGSNFKLVFVTASTPVLIKRFQETRRKHPLANGMHVTDAIVKEQQILEPLCDTANHIITTDTLTIGQLRRLVSSLFLPASTQQLLVTFMSFGFKYGLPLESNFIWDVRSLPNPYFVPALRPLKGTDTDIQEYLFGLPEVQEYWQRLFEFVKFAIEAAFQEGRSCITLAVGCTGGRHRSVALVQRLGDHQFEHATPVITHRDVKRDSYQEST